MCDRDDANGDAAVCRVIDRYCQLFDDDNDDRELPS